jgi:hypothetical protein
MTVTLVKATCEDIKCTEGLTECAGCNGYGVLTMGGRKYQRRSKGKNISVTAVAHEVCHGSGLVRCGCVINLDGPTEAFLMGVSA